MRLPGIETAVASLAAGTLTVTTANRSAGARSGRRGDRGSRVCRSVSAMPRPRVSPRPRSGGSDGWRNAPSRSCSGWSGLLAACWAYPKRSLFPAFTLAMVLAGYPAVRAAWFAIKARRADMNVLMSVAAIGAVALGEWEEGATAIVLFAVGLTLQGLTVERTRRAIRALMALAPAEARVVRNGVERMVPVADVAIGEVVLVRPGERIAGRRHRCHREVRRRSVSHHWGVDPGRRRAGFPRLRRGHQRRRRPAGRIDRRRDRHHAGPDRSSGRGVAGLACSCPGVRRPVCRDLHPAGDRRRRPGRHDWPAGDRRCPRLDQPGVDPAGSRLSLRPGHLDAGGARLRDRGFVPPGRPVQGRRGDRGAGEGTGRRFRQDRHPDCRAAIGGADRPFGRSDGGCAARPGRRQSIGKRPTRLPELLSPPPMPASSTFRRRRRRRVSQGLAPALCWMAKLFWSAVSGCSPPIIPGSRAGR